MLCIFIRDRLRNPLKSQPLLPMLHRIFLFREFIIGGLRQAQNFFLFCIPQLLIRRGLVIISYVVPRDISSLPGTTTRGPEHLRLGSSFNHGD